MSLDDDDDDDDDDQLATPNPARTTRGSLQRFAHGDDANTNLFVDAFLLLPQVHRFCNAVLINASSGSIGRLRHPRRHHLHHHRRHHHHSLALGLFLHASQRHNVLKRTA